MTCYCSRCVPNDIPKDPWRVACSRCGQEVRFGVVQGQKGWWHREAVDHIAVLGHMVPLAVSNMLEAAEAAEPEPEPEVEVWAHPVDMTEFPGQSGIRQIAALVSGETRVSPTTGRPSKAKNAVPVAPGWELVNITHSRGPYRGAKGEVLSISDVHVLRARGPVEVDGSRRVAVGSWRDLAFDFAYVGVIRDGRLNPRRVSSTEMKDWIKGHDLPDPVPPPGE